MNPGVFTRIDRDLAAALAPLPEVRERVDGCVSFSHATRDFQDRQAPTPEEVDGRRKHLRAALSEFASIEDAAATDFRALGKCQPPRMHDLPDPRIHVVRLLRHANVHLAATSLSHAHRDAVWPSPDGDHHFSYVLVFASDLDVSIRATRDAGRYDPGSLDRMIAWLEAEQREWGIGHVVMRTAELYATYLLAAL